MKKSQDKNTDTEYLTLTRIGKHLPIPAEELAKEGYTMYTHNRSRQRSRLSQENTDSETPTTDRHTSRERRVST